MPPADNRLYMGIDLGTSRSSTAAGNGRREWIGSYVGWPKDFVAAQVVGRKVLLGDAALKHRLSLDICRPLERGVIREGIARSEEAVKEIIGHMIDTINQEPTAIIHAVVGVPAESLNVNKLAIRNAVSRFVHSLMVVSEPFAVAYGMGLLDNAMVIDIGAGTTDFCVMHGTLPLEEDQKTILTAGDYIDAQLLASFSEKYPEAGFNLHQVRRLKEEHSFVGNLPEEIQIEIPVNGRRAAYDIKDEIRRACESILPALIETTAEMISRYEPEFQERIKKNIVLAGGGSLIRGIGVALREALREYGDFRVTRVVDPLFAGSLGALKLAREMPPHYWEML